MSVQDTKACVGMCASVCLSAVFTQAQQALVDTQRLLPAKTPPSLPGRSCHAQAEGLCSTCGGAVPNHAVTRVPRLRDGQEVGGLGQRWRELGVQDGLSSTHHATPGAPCARGQCPGTPRLPPE